MVENFDYIKFETIKKVTQTKFKFKDLKNINKLDSNSPPSVFVGSKLKYPNVNVGILSPLEREDNSWMYSAEKYWADENFQVGDVVLLRSGLMNSRFQTKVNDVRSQSSHSGKKFLDIAKEIAMSTKQIDVEIELKKQLHLNKGIDRVVTPHGMRSTLKKARVVGNPTIPQKIDKVYNDDMKAVEAMEYLYKNEFDEYTLNKILSIGVLGMKKNRKLVPTRWSITTTDDTLGKMLLKKIRDYPWIEDYEFYVGGFMGNYYLVLLFPGIWSYELFELYFPGSSWNPSDVMKASTDDEGYYGRKTYASNTVGGYYAARLPILELLNQRRKQASVLAIRLETPSYWAALGVWVVRESTRKTMKGRGIKFIDKNEMLNSAKQIAKVKYDFDPTSIFDKSKLLKTMKTQRRLQEFF
ncbi:hypothetical protein COU57_03025 [Candidatus Pacearchaeota archaeon CG10_big_fil_rev_8_21_14_0_10_32_14]|nr:MAG: hypothetical protein COU57_03025 [Candidatus Pacearchaeota archaeon CG10_big_fil_rev_8_21_14_0_10_32_14]